MTGPAWLCDVLAGAMLATALYALSRTVSASRRGRKVHYDIDIAHAVMGLAMAAMLVPDLDFLASAIWEVIFGVLAVWFSWATALSVIRHGLRAGEDGPAHDASHLLTHAVMGYSMLFMYLAPTMRPAGLARMAMTGPQGSSEALWLSPLLIMVILGCVGLELDMTYRVAHFPAGRLLAAPVLTSVPARPLGRRSEKSKPAPHSGDSRLWLAPRLETACHFAMCLIMGYMLIVMR
ncbi:MAG: DUF5134 domain-containing protein [Acidimicrobiales bacterium]